MSKTIESQKARDGVPFTQLVCGVDGSPEASRRLSKPAGSLPGARLC